MGSGDPRLSTGMKALMARPKESLMVSAVVAWEFTDLELRGRFPAGVNLQALLESFAMTVADFPGNAWLLAKALPDIHRDPVDRMLIAHAIHDGHTLVSADAVIRRYPVKTLW